MTVSVRIAADDEELLEAARIDLSAFALPVARTPAASGNLKSSLSWRRPTTTYLADVEGVPCATARVYDMDLSTPGAMSVRVSGIGDVGVLPGYRGHGALRALVTRMFEDAGSRGHVAMALYASEATIYGRFGFGPATRACRVTIPVERAALRDDVSIAAGRSSLVEPSEWTEVLPGVFERASLRRGGEVSRSPEIWDKVLCGGGPASSAAAGGLGDTPGADGRFCMLHRGVDGEPQAYALYSVREAWEPEGPDHSMTVDELVAVDVPSELALWQALFSVGLVQRVTAWVPPHSPLLDALVDRWAPSVSGEHDKLWVRLVDPVAALASRRYRIPGEATFAVSDPMRGGDVQVLSLTVDGPGEPGQVTERDVLPGSSAAGGTRTGSTRAGGTRADVTLGAAELAAVWLGGGSLASLAAVGRVVEGAAGSAARLDAMFGWSPLPGVTHDF